MDYLSLESAYQLIKARDARFDGRFYWGIKTTHIYCRPTCPANPKIQNIKIYRSKAEAENAGLRPCLRCRPDLSPTSPLWEGTAAVVSRALRILNTNDHLSLLHVADKVGLSDRHLRRLFDEHLGASPLDIVQSNRLHMARGLLSQTQLSITDIAFASGFQSIRRFNDAFKTKYRRNPRDFRKASSPLLENEGLTVSVPYLEPFDWEGLYTYFKNHQVFGTEYVENNHYYRALKIEDRIIQLKVSNNSAKKELKVNIQNARPVDLKKVLRLVRFVFDVDHNPQVLMKNGDLDKAFRKPILKTWGGHRIPGTFNAFERSICIILGQLVSTEQARTKFQKLMENFGEKIKTSDERLSILFPTPEKLIKADLKILGITRVRENAIREVCKLFIEGKVDVSAECSVEAVKAEFLSIKGIGPWTVELIALMCLGETNAYPQSDLILRRAEDLLKIKTQKWTPWRGYLAMWIWKHYALKLSAKNKILKPGVSKKIKSKPLGVSI